MGHKNREIEVKYIVQSGHSLAKVNSAVIELLKDRLVNTITGKSKDVYFHPTANAKMDFVRVRFGIDNDQSYITLKHTDKKTTLDRLEFDLKIDNPEMAQDILQRCIGPIAGCLRKRYFSHFLDSYDNVSVYQITGDKRVFIEVEAANKTRLNKIIKMLKRLDLDLEVSPRSLYQIFLSPDYFD
ncbi:CYTH domain containing protein [uncultured Caudovirales phage]|uniref:CYTH domain containing protein n=1 Tax=uncultured Caudovirales phage TaxID=2100421 RepID=A0A6J7WT37_9CAUD|nr:CYTH domain containing protein [uncultured Caudovirales phage]